MREVGDVVRPVCRSELQKGRSGVCVGGSFRNGEDLTDFPDGLAHGNSGEHLECRTATYGCFAARGSTGSKNARRPHHRQNEITARCALVHISLKVGFRAIERTRFAILPTSTADLA
jgi:hypothetical protein